MAIEVGFGGIRSSGQSVAVVFPHLAATFLCVKLLESLGDDQSKNEVN